MSPLNPYIFLTMKQPEVLQHDSIQSKRNPNPLEALSPRSSPEAFGKVTLNPSVARTPQ